jgi:2-oxoglutarate dehydrogenase E2 component (dihydrolipoamide succinyltransferase)
MKISLRFKVKVLKGTLNLIKNLKQKKIMILEMKVPSLGIYKEVEITTWLVKRRLRRKDQACRGLILIKATLELPAEANGIITLKAEEGDAVAVGAVVCLIDTAAAKPSGSAPAAAETAQSSRSSKAETTVPAQKRLNGSNLQEHHLSSKKKMMTKNIAPALRNW